MKLRVATLEDVPQVRLLEKQIIEHERKVAPTIKDGDDVWYYNIPALIADVEKSVLVVLDNDGELIGCGLGQIRKNSHYFKETDFGYIGMMSVKEGFRNNGYGGEVIKEIIKWFKTKNIKEVKLSVFAGNAGAIKAYKKLGFEDYLVDMKLEI